MPVLTTILNNASISFSQIASEAGISLSNVDMLQLANAYSGVSNVGEIPICEFYSNGCLGVIPATPTGMSATLSSGLTFNLSWNASLYTTSYKIYRNGVYYKTVTGTSTTGDGVSYSTQYCWKVSAVNANGESAQSAQSCATTGTQQSLYLVEYVYGSNATIACDELSEANQFYVDAQFILDVTQIYSDNGVTYAPSAYYSSAGDGVWIRWSSTGVVLSSGICVNPI